MHGIVSLAEEGEGTGMSQLRIFCYMPSPRVWKAMIAARLCGVELEIRSVPPPKLKDWLWDFDARPLTGQEKKSNLNVCAGHTGFKGNILYKTDEFLRAHPFGTVPAAFAPDGTVGIFESNSIMRAVARLDKTGSGIYGDDPYTASRIDSYLDASLVFARDSQIYMLSLADNGVTRAIYDSTRKAFDVYMSAIDRAMRSGDSFLVGGQLTLADICFACEFALFLREGKRKEALFDIGLEVITATSSERFPRAIGHFQKLCQHEAFSPELHASMSP